jgi:hypothetical protein
VSVNSYAPPRRRVSLFGILGTIGGVILLAVAGAAVKNFVLGDGTPVMPDTFGGRAKVAAAQDFGQQDDWRETAGEGVAGAAYGDTKEGRLHVTASRTDLTGRLDLAYAADQGEVHGSVNCTRNVAIGGRATTTFLLCWRTSPERSVIAFALTKPPAPEELAEDVDTLWQKLG